MLQCPTHHFPQSKQIWLKGFLAPWPVSFLFTIPWYFPLFYILTYLNPTEGCYWALGPSSTDLPHTSFTFLVFWANLFSWTPAMIVFSPIALRSFFIVLLCYILFYFICSPKPSYLYMFQIPDSPATPMYTIKCTCSNFPNWPSPWTSILSWYFAHFTQPPSPSIHLETICSSLSSTCPDTPEFFYLICASGFCFVCNFPPLFCLSPKRIIDDVKDFSFLTNI